MLIPLNTAVVIPVLNDVMIYAAIKEQSTHNAIIQPVMQWSACMER